MKRSSVGLLFIFMVVASLLLSACGSGGGGGPTPVPGLLGFPLDQDVPDSTVKPNNSDGCAPGSTRMTHQHVKGASSIDFLDAAVNPEGVQRIRVVIVSGIYTLQIHPQLGPNCKDMGPNSPTITVDFAVTYLADVDHSQNPVCVFRSRADFSQFDVKNSPSALDAFILDKARSGILEALDQQTANTLNPFYYNNAQRDGNAAVRCNWSELQP